MFQFNVLAGTRCGFVKSVQAMIQYRFITPNRRGKWYDTLATAQMYAERLGAGFLDQAGHFVPYRGTILQMRSKALPGD